MESGAHEPRSGSGQRCLVVAISACAVSCTTAHVRVVGGGTFQKASKKPRVMLRPWLGRTGLVLGLARGKRRKCGEGMLVWMVVGHLRSGWWVLCLRSDPQRMWTRMMDKG